MKLHLFPFLRAMLATQDTCPIKTQETLLNPNLKQWPKLYLRTDTVQILVFKKIEYGTVPNQENYFRSEYQLHKNFYP